jgi:hypothetical protein
MPSEGTVTVLDYQGGEPRPIRTFRVEPMPGRPGYWQGRLRLERAGEASLMEAWRENRSRLGMPGLDAVTIQWTDYGRGVAYQYTGAALRFDGDGFTFDGATRTP